MGFSHQNKLCHDRHNPISVAQSSSTIATKHHTVAVAPPSAGFTSSWVALALAWKEAELTLADELGKLLGHDLRGRSRDESWEGIGKRRKAW